MNKSAILLLVSTAASLLFSLSNIVFYADIALAAFPLSALFTALLIYFGLIRLCLRTEARFLDAVRKLLQYLPFALLASFVFRRAGEADSGYAFDLFSVIVWLIASLSAEIFLFLTAAKRLERTSPAWLVQKKEEEPEASVGSWLKTLGSEHRLTPFPWSWKRFGRELREWADAFLQAAFTVLLINIFIIQLYEIPSESMVPEFLIGDRVAVFKTPSGPHFPLSQVGIPRIRQYRRGDIVVFRNPHYSHDRKSEVQNFVSQLVYMLSFTGINLNRTADGAEKADPLVKRIAGESGEQLLMQDGVLYARREGESLFRPVSGDARWAEWNVAGLPEKTRSQVRQIPFPQEYYQLMLDVESRRNALSFSQLRDETGELTERFRTLALSMTQQGAARLDPLSLVSRNDLLAYNLFSHIDSITMRLLTLEGGSEWFSTFMTAWQSAVPEACFDGEYEPSVNDTGRLVGGDLYSDANFRLNLMIKQTAGALIVRSAELLIAGSPSSQWKDDSELSGLRERAQELLFYVECLDGRNMPLFPANDSEGRPRYIPKDEYFMMGDNRFNSTDMRHSYDLRLKEISPSDPYSVLYMSRMAPQSVSADYILGSTAYRVWPWNRLGIPGVTGKS